MIKNVKCVTNYFCHISNAQDSQFAIQGNPQAYELIPKPSQYLIRGLNLSLKISEVVLALINNYPKSHQNLI